MTPYLKPSYIACLLTALLAGSYSAGRAVKSDVRELPASYSVKQLTSGPKHHFYGYQGHAGNTPWDGGNTKLLLLETDFQDRFIKRDDAAGIVLVDEATGAMTRLTETRAWNFQQGTMLYWNPRQPRTEFFFNDRSPDNKIKTALFNIKTKKRREFFFPAAPIGNSGVAQKGGKFLAFNYARLARLRPTVGYAEPRDWTTGNKHPADDGLWLVDVATGKPKLILSYRQIHEKFAGKYPEMSGYEIFLNHSLWNRDDTRILLAARWVDTNKTLKSIWLTLAPDGSDVVELLGNPGHPDWEAGENILCVFRPAGDKDRAMSLVNTRTTAVLQKIGADFFTSDGDLSLAADRNWMATTAGAGQGKARVVFYSRAAGAGTKGPVVEVGPYTSSYGEWNEDPTKRMYHLNRIDVSPCWNRDATKVYFFGLAADGTRQAFIATLKWDEKQTQLSESGVDAP